jgi:para-nitrobenzyl esterase
VIWGNTRDEGRLTAATIPERFNYHQLLVDAFGAEKAARIEAEYTAAKYGSDRVAYGAVLTDRVWACNQLADDRLLARRVPTYSYEFADRTAPVGFFKDLFPSGFPTGAFHSSEVAYLFETPTFDLNAEQRALADQMITYWTRFAKTGNPNAHGLPDWPKTRDDKVQSLTPGDIKLLDGYREHNCGFWA